MESKQL